MERNAKRVEDRARRKRKIFKGPHGEKGRNTKTQSNPKRKEGGGERKAEVHGGKTIALVTRWTA